MHNTFENTNKTSPFKKLKYDTGQKFHGPEISVPGPGSCKNEIFDPNLARTYRNL